MQRCFDLALLGLGNTAPNPLVGSVIVHQDKIIGEGYHEKYGEAHAEVNAINSVKHKSLLTESTIYVNLEPCAHFGKTPPCSDLIIKHNIPKVVIGCIDTFDEVAGKGVEKLEAKGCKVEVGVLEDQAKELNKRFFTFHNKKRPYVILKWAQSSDGFIDIDRSNGKKGIAWISGPETKQVVHKWRHEEAGILVGKNTVLTDNPSLTVREIEGNSPIRFVLDTNNSIDLEKYQIGNQPPATFKLTGLDTSTAENILNFLYNKSIQSVIIEGGASTLNTFIECGLWDEARVITGSKIFQTGIKAPLLRINPTKTQKSQTDTIIYYYND